MKSFAILSLAAAAVAAPTSSNSKRQTPPATIDPLLSQYNVATGAVTYNTGEGYIFKKNGAEPDITTLMSFKFPDSTEGYNCEILFPLDAASTATGSQRAQVFSGLKPAAETTTTWPSGNLRDQHLGDVKFEAPGGAVYEATYGPYAQGKFPCPAGYKLGAELVGRWDEVTVAWTQGAGAGPYIEVTAA
ncbi:hypothetical protein MKZ38_000772 [Zalerion maritima]|uniref:Ubiquitin 3 binding protein But2 C-terminal domain-containing protein n=1 Tax=Zalerion maritima TaxID=339359 RepID=A0AAD5RFM0_9PEZI|nr:hypothetical protein MKZ38_000772 [Zalerion maritima]